MVAKNKEIQDQTILETAWFSTFINDLRYSAFLQTVDAKLFNRTYDELCTDPSNAAGQVPKLGIKNLIIAYLRLLVHLERSIERIGFQLLDRTIHARITLYASNPADEMAMLLITGKLNCDFAPFDLNIEMELLSGKADDPLSSAVFSFRKN